MAFGAVRKAYKAPAKFFTDDLAADNQIIWYYVPDGTEIYDGWTVFTPRVDTPPNEATSAHEAEGLGRILRTFYDGADVFGFSGTHVHGDDEDFRGLALREKYFIDDVPPAPPCMRVRHNVGILLGFKIIDVPSLRCACCEDVDSPETFTLHTESPGIPMFDDLEIEVSLVGGGPNCSWFGGVSTGSGFLGVTITTNVDDPPHSLQLAWQWIAIPFDTYTGGAAIEGEGFNCDPWFVDTTTNVYHNFEPTGDTVRFVSFRDEVETMHLGLLLGARSVFVPQPPIVMHLGLLLGLKSMDP